MNTDTDRERGLLSEADREFLLGEREYGHDQSRRNAAARIRRRVRHGILDFDLLLHTLPDRDRRGVFEDVHTDHELLDGLRAAVAFAYVGAKEQGLDFEEVLVPAVRASEEAYAARQSSERVSVEVEFSAETTVETALSGIAARIDDGDPVTPRELFALLMEEEIDHDWERIPLLRDTDDDADEEFVARLARYLEAEVRDVTEKRTVLVR